MPNLYVFYKGNTAPSGWTRTTTYDGRYARCGSTHGATAGNSTHTHTLSSYTVANGTQVGWTTKSDSGYMSVHNHTMTMNSCSSDNNDPPYYTLSLIYIDASTFESNVKAFPSGVVVASSAAISHSDFTRETALDSRFIKLGDYGSTGGRSATTAGHSCSFNLDAKTPTSMTGNSWSSTAGGCNNGSHSHTLSTTSNTSTTLPKKVTTRLYTANKTTTSIPVNVVCFFDGTPSSKWTAITAWNDACIYGGDLNPTVDGSDTHTHGAMSGTSSSITDGAYDYGQTGTAAYCTAHTHSHAVSGINLSTGNHLPLVVMLVPYYLNTQMVPQQTLDKTCSIDMVLKRVQTTTASVDIVVKKRGIDTTANVDMLLKKAQAIGWQVNLAMKKAQDATFKMDLLARKALDMGYDSDILMRKALTLDYETDLLVKKAQEQGYNGDLLVKKTQDLTCEADLLMKKAQEQTYATDLLMKKALDSTYGMDLLAKKTVENEYQASMLLISGRKIEYTAGLKIIKALDLNYDANILLQKRGVEATYEMAASLKKSLELGYGVDLDIQRAFETSANINILLKKQGSLDFAADLLMLKRGVELDYTAGLTLAKFIHKRYDANLSVKKPFSQDYAASIFLTNRLMATYSADISMRKALQILYFIGLQMRRPWDKTYAANLLVEKSLEASYEMGIDLFTLSVIHYQATMKIWGHKDIHYGMMMKTRKGGIEAGYGAQIKIILPLHKPRKLRSSVREEYPAVITSQGSTYKRTDSIPGPSIRLSEHEVPQETVLTQGSHYSPTDTIPGPTLRPTEKEENETPESEGSSYSPTREIQYQKELRPGKAQF